MTLAYPSDPSSSSSSASTSAVLTSHIPSNFTYQPLYDQQLASIAASDEIPDDCRWGDLKNAIKFRIIRTLGDFEDKPKPWLHPAARELQQQQQQQNQAEQSLAAKNGSNGRAQRHAGNTANDVEDEEDEEDKMSVDATDGQRIAQSERLDAWATQDHPRNLNTADSDSDSDPEFPTSTGAALANAPLAGEDTTLTSVDAIDRSGFYPAKTQPPPERHGSWGRRLAQEEVEEEVGMLFALLDEFESSPPFTIQRLCELILSPRAYVRSGPKFLSSLTRILAITATHSDFPPVSPGPLPLVNGHDFPGMGQGFGASAGSALTSMPRDVGPPSPVSEPLFSPVPFLQRRLEENGLRAQQGEESQGDGGETMSNGEVPHLDLEDEPVAEAMQPSSETQDQRERYTPVASITTDNSQSQSQQRDTTSQQATQPSTHISDLISASATAESTSSSSSSSATASQPLGVPKGRVDELDDISGGGHSGDSSGSTPSGAVATASATGTTGERRLSNEGGQVEHRMDNLVHPISSTTTTPVTTAPAAQGGLTISAAQTGSVGSTGGAGSVAMAREEREEMDEEEQVEEVGDERRSKRLKSEEI